MKESKKFILAILLLIFNLSLLAQGPKNREDVSKVFSNGQKLRDFYSDESFEVKEGSITIQGPKSVVLLEKQ